MSYNAPPPPPADGGNNGGYNAPPPPADGGYGQGGYGQGGYGQGGYGAPAPQGNNQKAIWSLVLGILGLLCCGFFTGIPAIILGRSAQKEIAQTGQQGAGLAKAGFIIGIVACVLSVIGIIWTLTTGGFSGSFSS